MKLRTALLAALVCLCQAAAVQATEPTGLASADMAAMPIAAPILDRLDAAWDAADGARFAAEFTDDADVNQHLRRALQGPRRPRAANAVHLRRAVQGQPPRRPRARDARYLAPDTILVVSSSRVTVPSGPLSPETRNRQTFILVRDGETWRIRHWHNTTVARPG